MTALLLPAIVGWSSPQDSTLGFVNPTSYTTPDIICHLGATPGGIYATVAAGDTVELQWTPWPSSHHGPVIDYLANCNGECTSVDKTTLLFNKIDELGLIDDSAAPGMWAADQLRIANNSWTVSIPSSIAPGNYVLRHEIIALHSADASNGAQNYPQCVNLKITGSGTNTLSSGTLGTALYLSTDPGILVNIYTKLSSYIVPGPVLLQDATPGTRSSSIAVSAFSPMPTTFSVSITQLEPHSSHSSGLDALATTLSISSTMPTYPNSSATASSDFGGRETTNESITPAISTNFHSFATQLLNSSPGLGASPITPSASAPVLNPTFLPSLPTNLPTSIVSAEPSLSVPFPALSAITSRPSSLPTACAISDFATTPINNATVDACDPSPADSLPNGITLEEFFTWLHAVSLYMFRAGKGPLATRTKQHARSFIS
ncbi:hypothetical protein MMC13_008373 [Lambiella insularis]|nr:hypothetical protein [Lambiella insularis]